MLTNWMKSRLLNYTPERFHPLFEGVYDTLFYKKNKRKSDTSKSKSPYQDISRLLEIDSPVIVDGGAYKGETTTKFLDLFPSATIHAFEPLPKHINSLRKKYENNTNVYIHDNAIGNDSGKNEIKVNPKSNTSSVFETTDALREKKKSPTSPLI
jgi:hypothetical protein